MWFVNMLFMCILIVLKFVWVNVVVIFRCEFIFCFFNIVIFGLMFLVIYGVVMLLFIL